MLCHCPFPHMFSSPNAFVCLQDFAIANDVIAQQQDISRVHQRRPSGTARMNVEHGPIDAFIEKYQNERGKFRRMCDDIQQLPCKHMSITRIIKKIVPHIGTVIDLVAMRDEVDDFLTAHGLTPLTEFNLRESVGYANFKENAIDNAIDSLLITTTGALRSNLAIAISVDYIVSDTKSVAYRMIKRLKQYVGKRKQASFVFTQASKEPRALKFWRARLTQSKWANVYVALMHQYCADYEIYTDTVSLIS